MYAISSLLELYQQGWLAATDVQTLVESVYSYTLQMAMVAPSFAPMTAWVHRLRRLASLRALERSVISGGTLSASFAMFVLSKAALSLYSSRILVVVSVEAILE